MQSILWISNFVECFGIDIFICDFSFVGILDNYSTVRNSRNIIS